MATAQFGNEPRFASGPLKRRAQEPLRKPVVKKPEPKIVPAQRADSPAPSTPSKQTTPTKPPPGHCELNPFMTRALNMELQDVMIKVWQALPDDPKTDAEKYSIEKLKTDTGDDIRNVMGLNVAKRLLNIFNPLNVKIHFSNIPQRAYLRSFLKKYSFISFKRVERTTKTFSATVKTIQDFDRLCGGDDLRCGSSKVTVSPSYRFTHCPSKLKAIEKFDSTKERLKIQEANDKTVNEAAASSDIIKANVKQENLTKDETQNKENKASDKIIREEYFTVSINSKPPVILTQAKTVTKTETEVQSPQVKQEPKPQVKTETSVNLKQAETQVKVTPSKQTTQNTPAKPTSNTTQVQSSQVKTAENKNQVQNSQVKQNTAATKQAQNSPAKPIANTKEQGQNSQVKPTTLTKSQEQKPQVKATVTNTQGDQNPQVKPTLNTKPEGQTSQVKSATENKLQGQNSQVKTSTQDKPQIQNTQVKTTTQNKPQGQSPQVKPSANAKPQVKPTASKQQAQNAQVKPSAVTKQATITKPQVQKSPVKPVRKPQEKNVSKPNAKSKFPPKVEKKSYKDKDDFEELDDYDILALMSEGIILDECSGSDEE